jgi:hypothetical protein
VDVHVVVGVAVGDPVIVDETVVVSVLEIVCKMVCV